jgi:uncharacterized protein DUF4268
VRSTIGTSDAAFNSSLFERLLESREAIEAELEQALEWEPLEDRLASRIALYCEGSVNDTEQLGDYRDWHVDHLLTFRRIFGDRIRDLARGMDTT